MPYRNFRVPIYEHTDNKTIIHSSKRFFYFSIPFLNYPSAVGSATTSPGSMNCDSPSKCGTKKLKNKLPATSVSWWESVFIIIRLRSYLLIRWSPLATSTRAWQCKHSNWLPYQMQKDFWFSVILNPEKKEISDSVLLMRNQPKRFMNDFTVLFSTSSETFMHGQKTRYRVSIKCGRGPWTVDRLKCGLLPVDSTFFSVHIGHFLVIFRLKCGPKKVDSKKKIAFLVIFFGHF